MAPGDLRTTRSGTNASRVSSLGEASPAGGQQAAVEAAAKVVAAGRRASEGNAAHPSAKGYGARDVSWVVVFATWLGVGRGRGAGICLLFVCCLVCL